jgi:hypothetical protein
MPDSLDIPLIENEFENEFRKRFKDPSLKIIHTSNEKDFVICNEKTSKAILVRTIEPIPEAEPRDYRLPDPQLDAEVVECYRFRIGDSVYPPDTYVFIYNNLFTGTKNFLMFTEDELIKRLKALKENPDESQFCHLLIWVLPENYVFAANNMSTDEEWYLMGSGSSQHFERDLSGFLNRWDIFK